MKNSIFVLLTLFFISLPTISFSQLEGCDCAFELDIVCAQNSDEFTMIFPNECFANCLGFEVTEDGCDEFENYLECGCEFELDPVCISDDLGTIYTFPNACFAECFGLNIVEGDCEYDENESDSTDCTLTQGYWKNHSELGPAPYDSTWAELGDGANTLFFETGYSYYEILHLSNSNGNAYLTLSKQWIAAELNAIAGASVPEDVNLAWNDGAELLETNESLAFIENGDEGYEDAINMAGLLDEYNNGVIGPGHCEDSDDETLSIAFNPSSGIPAFSILMAYPNPSENEFNISFEAHAGLNVMIQVTSVTGAVVEKQLIQTDSGKQVILFDTRAYSNGMYFVQFLVNNKPQEVIKLVKK